MKKTLLTSSIASLMYHGFSVPTKAPSSSSIQWGHCLESDPPNLDCGKLQVPLNWDEPNGNSINLTIYRLKAADHGNRLGSLIYNPGGPGIPATIICRLHASGSPWFSPSLSDRFDIICPDPRGVGLSTPVQCDTAVWDERVQVFPTDKKAFQKLVAHNKVLGESCLKKTGPLIRHIDTISAAKDVDAIRIALDDGKLNWFGTSYGSMLGAAYAELFPDNIGRMILDGIVDHSQQATDAFITESSSYEDSLNRFFTWCDNNRTCAIHSHNTAEIFDSLVKEANKKPIPAPGCVESSQCRLNVTGDEIMDNVQGLILTRTPQRYLGNGWVGLSQALNETIDGNGTLLSTALVAHQKSSPFSGLTIGCLDWAHNNDTSDATLASLQYNRLLASSFLSPHTKGMCQTSSYQARCIGWPAALANPPHRLNQSAMQRIKTPILLVNAAHDPSTSYVWARGLLSQIPTGVLLTRRGDGHTSYTLGGETAKAIDEYLIDGKVPLAGTVLNS